MNVWFEKILRRWADISFRRRWWIFAVGTILFFTAVFFAAKLRLRSDLIELLPSDAPSVVNLEYLKQRVSSYATLVVTVESPDLKANERFAEALAVRLRAYPPERIKFVDYNLSELTDFYKKFKHLYADLPDLIDFRDRLKKRIQEETEDSVVESLDDEAKPKTDLKISELRAKYEKKAKEQDRYPDGYYVTPDRSLLAIFIRPPSGASSFDEAEALVDDIQKDIDALNPSSFYPSMTTGFTGDLKTGIEERDALADDMLFISSMCIILLLVLIILYYRSARSVFIVGAPTFLGVATAFAVGYFTVGYLNTATAFLSSIIAGNGINFMIMLAARVYEEIHNRGPDKIQDILRIAVPSAAKGTFIAAVATAIAYGSLVFASFRGFRQFGIIGGIGMLVCWISAFAFGPALVAVFHTIKPLGQHKSNSKHRVAGVVAKLVTNYPKRILIGSVILSVLAVTVLVPYASDPFEYDFHKLRNRVSAQRGSAKLSNRVDKIFDLPASPTPVITEELDDVPRIKAEMLAYPGALDVIGDVKTLFDFLPKEQEPKLAVLNELRTMIDRKIDFLDEKDRKDIEEYRPPEDLHVVGLADLPDKVAWTFTENDGTRGRILYVYAKKGESLLNGRYLMKFAAFVRNFRIKDAELTAVGQAMVFADMITAILRDGTMVTGISFAGVMVLLLVAFRSRRGLIAIMISVTLGTLWMIGFTALFDLKLNFLNFVVVPITLGISVDYGANIFSRYRQEGPGSILSVIQSTGGAVFLCSLTTVIGYATLIMSTNMALQSFGIIADIGEIACLAAAEITMTALLVWLEHKYPNSKSLTEQNS